MPDTVVDIPGVGVIAFPEGMSQAQIAIAAKNMTTQSDSGAIPMQAASKLAGPAVTALEEIATNPNAASIAGKVGGMIGSAAPTYYGLKKFGELGLLSGIGAAEKGQQAGLKIGGILGDLAQKAAGPAASVVEKVAPYAQTLSTLSGAQGLGDLAQMAEPNRRDIGFLGVGPSVNATPDQDAIAASQQAHQDRWAKESAARQEQVMKWAAKMPESVRGSFLSLLGYKSK